MNRRRWIWTGAALLFVLAVGSGYLPDLTLSREMAAARKEGLLDPPDPEPFVPVGKDARLAYADAFRSEAAGLMWLHTAPNNPAILAKPGVQRLLDAVAEASKKPLYLSPAGSERLGMPGNAGNLNIDLRYVAQILARGPEDRLLAAARIARHLQSDDPLGIPSSDWATIANRVLDAADRLPASSRTRIVAALGRPDPIALVRRHVRACLVKLQKEEGRSAGLTRRKARFVSFWRGFLNSAPRDPAAFARRVKGTEGMMVEVDNAVNVGYEVYLSTAAKPDTWTGWAEKTAKALARFDRGR